MWVESVEVENVTLPSRSVTLPSRSYPCSANVLPYGVRTHTAIPTDTVRSSTAPVGCCLVLSVLVLPINQSVYLSSFVHVSFGCIGSSFPTPEFCLFPSRLPITMPSAEETLQHLGTVVKELQEQLALAQQQRVVTQTEVTHLKQQLFAFQQQERKLEPSTPRGATPRVPKPDSFNGKGDVRSWVWSLEQYFSTVGVDDSSRPQYAVNLLRGCAATWMRSITPNGALPSWTSLREGLIKTFAPISEEQNARDRLSSLKQRQSVSQYASTFRQILLLLPDMSVSDRIDRFARGLKLPIAREIYLRAPTTLEEAIRIADRYDSVSWKLRPRGQPNFSQGSTKTAIPAADPMDLSAVRFTRLSPTERKHIMDNNGCLYCRELNANHRAANCPKKSKQQSN